MLPAVSDALHAKVMSRVHAARREKLANDPEPRRRAIPHRVWRLSGAAVVGALALTVWLARPASAPKEPVHFEPMVASLRETAEPIRARFMLPMEQAERQIVLLKDDAVSLGTFVTDQLDILPIPQEKPL